MLLIAEQQKKATKKTSRHYDERASGGERRQMRNGRTLERSHPHLWALQRRHDRFVVVVVELVHALPAISAREGELVSYVLLL